MSPVHASTDGIHTGSESIARETLAYLAKARIPITPPNYTVWFYYFSKSNASLRRVVDEHVAKGQPLTEDLTRALYLRYAGGDEEEKVRQAQQTLRAILHSLVESVQAADGSLTDYSDSLIDGLAHLTGELPIEGVCNIVERLIVETKVAHEAATGLRSQITKKARESKSLKQQLEKTKREENTDYLTGLANRNGLGSTFKQAALNGLQGSHAPALLFIGADQLKDINDTNGHLTGDRVLQLLASTLKGYVRGKDIAARWGGEEFAVLLLDTPRSGSLAIAENIRLAVERNSAFGDGWVPSKSPVTVSIGVAWFRDGESFDELMNRANRALHESKARGRNRVSDEHCLVPTSEWEWSPE